MHRRNKDTPPGSPERMHALAEASNKTIALAINRILDYDMLIQTANEKIRVLWPTVEDRIEVVFQRRSRVELDGKVLLDMEPVLVRVRRSKHGWYQQRLERAPGQSLESLRPLKSGRNYPEGQRVKLLLRLIDGWLQERAAIEDVLRQLRQRTTTRVRTAPVYMKGAREVKLI